MRDLEVTDEGLGLEPSAERDRDDSGITPSYDRPPIDPEQDTGVIAVAGVGRSRPRRRPQAEKMR
jgi:hypothetical protein